MTFKKQIAVEFRKSFILAKKTSAYVSENGSRDSVAYFWPPLLKLLRMCPTLIFATSVAYHNFTKIVNIEYVFKIKEKKNLIRFMLTNKNNKELLFMFSSFNFN